MTDIVGRLHLCADDPMWDGFVEIPKSWCSEAAAEIERLRALLQELIDIEGPQPGTSDWYRKVVAALPLPPEDKP